ncbi:MAG: hypothetical protein H8D23_18955 [Candidatus Brocadiales bacterium]|nr:hypothetical protein [Candidatus Brocadiales bacterium]
MIELKHNELVFRLPEVHKDAICKIDFQRTLRIPDDNREYSLPPGLGRFQMEHTDDHSSKLSSMWAERGGVLLPMFQSEALWINFSGGYPFAVKIATGKVNAVTGEMWSNALVKEPQDYLVVPDQPWLDGYCVQKGLIRQFVAMPLGDGYTAEEQLTGSAEHGGLQIIVYPMKRELYEKMIKRNTDMVFEDVCCTMKMMNAPSEMGLAPGGLMRQEIYEDEYGFDAWDLDASSRCFVHILNSNQWHNVTGKPVPSSPPSAVDYTEAGLPWFEYYDDKLNKLKGANKLSGLDSVAAKTVKLGEQPLKDNEAVTPTKIHSLSHKSTKVAEGNW